MAGISKPLKGLLNHMHKEIQPRHKKRKGYQWLPRLTNVSKPLIYLQLHQQLVDEFKPWNKVEWMSVHGVMVEDIDKDIVAIF